MRHTIATVPAPPAFTPVTVTITAENIPDLALITNLFGGVPAESTNAAIDALASDLRAACDGAGIPKSARKTATGFNWGKKLRECLAEVEG